MTAFSFYNDFKKYQLERGQDRLPTLSLYRVVIIMFLNLHDLRAAETCFQELRDSKILKPNSYIYSTMMFAYLRARNRDKVLDLFSENSCNRKDFALTNETIYLSFLITFFTIHTYFYTLKHVSTHLHFNCFFPLILIN